MEKTRRDFLIQGLAGLVGLACPSLAYSQVPAPRAPGDVEVKPGVYDLGDPNRWNQPVPFQKPSPNYTLDDFILSYGKNDWDNLPAHVKQKITNDWQNYPLFHRKSVCEIYFSPRDFINTNFSPQQKAEYTNWERANFWLQRREAQRRINQNILGAIKISPVRAGLNQEQMQKEYDERYPWGINITEFDSHPGDGVIFYLFESNHLRQNRVDRVNPEFRRSYPAQTR